VIVAVVGEPLCCVKSSVSVKGNSRIGVLNLSCLVLDSFVVFHVVCLVNSALFYIILSGVIRV